MKALEHMDNATVEILGRSVCRDPGSIAAIRMRQAPLVMSVTGIPTPRVTSVYLGFESRSDDK
jgi:hypothetical protein